MGPLIEASRRLLCGSRAAEAASRVRKVHPEPWGAQLGRANQQHIHSNSTVRLSEPSPFLSCRPKILIAYELGSTESALSCCTDISHSREKM